MDQFRFILNNISLPGGFDYTRFSLRNLQNNFQGSGQLSNVGIAAVTLSAPISLAPISSLLLGELILNISGLPPGIYELAFNSAESDASGTIDGAVNEFLQDAGGLVSSNTRSVSINAVPEPTAWIGALSLLACPTNARRQMRF